MMVKKAWKKVVKRKFEVASLNGSNDNCERSRKDETRSRMRTGLTNEGQTCYMNVVMQMLWACTGFRSLCTQVAQRCEPEEACLFQQMDALFHEMSCKNDRLTMEMSNGASMEDDCTSTRDLMVCLEHQSKQFVRGVQQDVHEFLVTILAQLETLMTKRGLSDEFARQFKSTTCIQTTCRECEEKFYALDTFSILTLSPQAGISEITDLLADSATPEIFRGTNKYFCASCHSKVEAVKSSHFESLPENLFIQFNLRTVSYDNIHQGKDAAWAPAFIDRPLTLTTKKVHDYSPSKSTTHTHIYRLSSMILHSGSSMTRGHYTILIHHGDKKHDDDSSRPTWTFVDDSLASDVFPSSPSSPWTHIASTTGASTTPYLLLYTRHEKKKANE